MDNSLQEWADMYNKKDKEHFECQLKLAKLEQKLEKIKEMLELCEYYSCSDCVFDSCDNCTSECHKTILHLIEEQE